jgi:glutamyl-tRNA synthetase
MHIGNLRTALYAYLIAKHENGQFLLRVEDTDRERYVGDAVRVILESLEMAGISYDEGPGKEGECGPYVQSQRTAIYQAHARQLLEEGCAYRCFCPRDSAPAANEARTEAPPSDPCREISPEESDHRAMEGHAHVIRQRIPRGQTVCFEDRVYGKIEVETDTLDDQVLLKSDGFPTYNLANVVDDHLMGITHVVRGCEYLPSTPKFELLYRGFGWDSPQYIHLPHITKESGKKLSKREGDASFQDLLARGYLPEAIVNYIALLGWNPGDDREFFALSELVSEFTIDRINKSSAAFSIQKLDWLNGLHIRAMTGDRLAALVTENLPEGAQGRFDPSRVAELLRPRLTRITEIEGMTGFLSVLPDFPLEFFIHEKSKSTHATSREVLERAIACLEPLQEWRNESISEVLKGLSGTMGMKVATVMWPARIALTGTLASPGGASEMAAVLGREESIRRLREALERLNREGRVESQGG